MGLRNKVPLTFRPRGVTDTLDSTNSPGGSMLLTTNLVPSPSTPNAFAPRPAAAKTVDFVVGGFSGPTNITALMVLGSLAYGMVTTTRNANHDEPFVYDLANNVFITVTGVTAANTPTTQSTAGDWTPPTMTFNANKVIVTHPGFSGAAGVFFGVIDVSNPAVPAWSSANTATNLLTSVPTAVATFNGRTWYATKNNLTFSDSLVPTTVTNASQVLTLGDNVAITALGGLPLQSVTQGGVIQSLIAFKGEHTIFQITGDSATNNLGINQLNVATGTFSPKAVVGTPRGLAFISPEGLRFIDENANIGEPVGAYGTGIAIPLQNAVNPSRMVAAYNNDTLRVSLANGAKSGSPNEEYWYNFTTDRWTGPHTFTAYIISEITIGASGFLFGPQGINGSLWQGQAFPTLVSTFIENGSPLSWTWQTSLLPDNEKQAMNCVIETSIGMQLGAGQQLSIQAIDETGAILDTVMVSTPAGSQTIWGSFTWGQANWGGTSGFFRQYWIAWHQPIIFKQATIRMAGFSQIGTSIGNLYLGYQELGYNLEGDF